MCSKCTSWLIPADVKQLVCKINLFEPAALREAAVNMWETRGCEAPFQATGASHSAAPLLDTPGFSQKHVKLRIILSVLLVTDMHATSNKSRFCKTYRPRNVEESLHKWKRNQNLGMKLVFFVPFNRKCDDHELLQTFSYTKVKDSFGGV